MNYYNTKRNQFSKAITPFVAGAILTIAVAIFFDRKQKQRAETAEKQALNSTITVLEDLEKNLNKEIVQHYEKIDSLIFVRDSVVYEHSTKTVIQLQQAIDSIFNRQPYISDKAWSNTGTSK